MQASAIITRSNIVTYCLNSCRDWGRKSIKCWIQNRHPIPRPNGRAMGCRLWTFVRKLTGLWRHRTVLDNMAGTGVVISTMASRWYSPLCMAHCCSRYSSVIIYVSLARFSVIQGADSIKRCHVTSIGNPIVEIRRSYDRLISTMGFPILVRWYIDIESGPCSLIRRITILITWHIYICICMNISSLTSWTWSEYMVISVRYWGSCWKSL